MLWGRAKHPILLMVVGSILFFTNLGATRLWDVDEAIFSEASREMQERGDLIVPHFNGEIFTHKPPLLFWCQIAAYQLWGPTEFAARLGPALFGIGSMLVTYSLGRTLFSPRAGLWAGLILGSCVNFAVIARAATPDSPLIFFCTLALLILVRGTARRDATGEIALPWRPFLPPSWRTYTWAYAAMGVAVLVKGPVGLVLPTAVWGLFLLFEQRFQKRALGIVLPPRHPTAQRWDFWFQCLCAFHPTYVLQTIWRMRPLVAIAMLLLVAGPWYAWVGLRTDGQFLREFFGVHNFGRFASAMENHRGPFFYYIPAILIGVAPWGILLGPTIVNLVGIIRTRAPERSGVVLLLSWVAVWVGFFSVASTKLPSYVVPAYPALALLCAAAIDHWLRAPVPSARIWLRAAWGVAALGGVGILVVVPIASRVFLAGEVSPAYVGVVLLVGAVVGVVCSELGRLRWSLVTLATTSVVFCTWILGFSVLPVDAHQNSEQFAALIRERSSGATPHVGAFRYLPPSLVFYNQAPVEGLWNIDAAVAHFETHPRDAFIFTTEENYQRLANRLPHDVTVLAASRRFLRKNQIVLLGRANDSPAQVSRQIESRGIELNTRLR